ncbi:hypothetical protein, partial [Propionibacterium phage TCUCAP1]
CTGVQGWSPSGVGWFFTMRRVFLWFVVGIECLVRCDCLCFCCMFCR